MKNKKKHFVFFTNLLAFSIVAPIAASFLLNLQNGSKSNLSNSISNDIFDSEVIPGVWMHVETYYDSSASQTVAKIKGLVNKDAIPDNTIFSFPATVKNSSGNSYPLFGIGDGAFNNVNLSKTKCGGLTFKDATNLRFIDPNAFNTFGNFQESNIVTVFPASITKFGENSFQNCPLLTIEFTEKDPRKIIFGNAWKPNIESGRGYKISVPYSADESIVNAYVLATSFSKGEFLNGYYPTTLTISPRVTEVIAGETINVSAEYNDLGITVDPDSKIWWDSSDSSSVVIRTKINKSNDPNTITFNQPGTYTITANYTIDTYNKLSPQDSFTVTVKRPDVSGIDVTTPSNQQIRISDSTDFSFSAVVQPSTYYPDAEVTWSWATGEIPELSLDPTTGVVSYNPTASSKLSEGTYSFSLTATSVDNPTVSKTSDVVQLVVKKDYVTRLTVDPISDIDVIQTKPSTTPVTPTATVEPSTADQGVVWSLKEGTGTTTLPAWLTCDPVTGDIAWTATTKDDIGTYNIILVATSVGEKDSTGAKMVTETPFVVNVKHDDPTSITLSEGQTTLSGYASNAGAATSAFKATITPAEAKQEVTWSLDNAPNWLSVNNGLISWSNLATKGTYNFKVKATAVDDPTIIAISDPITLTIDFNHVQSVAKPTGPTSLDGFHNEAKRAATPFTTTVDPLDANQDVTWSLIGAPSWVSIDADGYISWTNDAQEGTYNFTVKATSVGLDVDGNTVNSPESETVTLTIKYAQPTSITITDGQYTGGNKAGIAGSLTAFKAKVLPDNAEQSVEWSIEDKSADFPTWISMDKNTGVVSWTTACVKGEWTFKVQAKTTSTDYDPITAKSNLITLSFDYADVVSVAKPTGPIGPLEGIKGEAKTIDTPFTTTVNPSNAEQKVTWKLEAATTGGTCPSWITIDENGKISWTADATPGTYDIVAVATSVGKDATGQPVSSKSDPISIVIKYAEPTSITITDGQYTGGNKAGIAGSLAAFKAKVLPDNAKQSVEWSLTDKSANFPSWITINSSTGVISWTDQCKKGEYSCKVKAKTTDTDYPSIEATTDQTVNLTFTYADVTDIVITTPTDFPTTDWVKGHSITTSSFTAVVQPDGFADPNVIWSIKTSEGSQELSGLTIDPNTGILTWDGTGDPGTYKFKVVATSNGTQSTGAHYVKETSEFVVNVVYDKPTSITINDGPTVAGQGGKGRWGKSNNPYTAVVETKEHVAQDVNWSLVDFKKDAAAEPVPTWLHISQGGESVPEISDDPLPAGLIYWDNNCIDGTYSVKVKVTAVEKSSTGTDVSATTTTDYNFVIDEATVDSIQLVDGTGLYTQTGTAGIAGTQLDPGFKAKTTYSDGTSDENTATWSITDVKKDGKTISKPAWLNITPDASGVAKVNWTNASEKGVYTFNIVATAAKDLNKNAKTTTPVTLTIDYAFVGDVLLTDTTVQENNESIIGSSGKLNDKFKATVNPKDGIGTIETGVTWKIEMDDGSQVPNWLHINTEGLVTWDNNAPIGDYAFHVVATSVGKMESGQQAVSNPSKTIKLKVKYADVANITISGGSGPSITSEINKSGSTEPYIATVNPVGTTLQDVTWKIETKDGSPLPDWISIDQNGKVSWTEHSNIGKYEFVIKAYANQEGSTSIFGEQDLTLTFNDIPVPPTPPKPEPTDNYDITRWIQIGLGLGIPTLIFGYTACYYIRISRRNDKNLINAIETKSPIVHRPQKTEEEKRQEQKLKEEKAEQQRIKQQEAEQQRIKAEEERIKAEQQRIKAEEEKIKQQERLKQQEAEEKEIKNLSDEAKERDEKSNKTSKL